MQKDRKVSALEMWEYDECCFNRPHNILDLVVLLAQWL